MKPKKVAIFLIVFLIICICVLMGILLYLMKLNTENLVNITNEDETNDIVFNETSNDNNFIEEDDSNNDSNLIGDDSSMEEEVSNLSQEELIDLKRSGILVDNYEENDNGVKIIYTKEEIDNYLFNINGVPDSVIKYINNIDDVYFKIKEYMYSNVQLKATEANYREVKFHNGDRALTIYFNLNYNNKELLVTIDLENQNDIYFENRVIEKAE